MYRYNFPGRKLKRQQEALVRWEKKLTEPGYKKIDAAKAQIAILGAKLKNG